MKVQKILTGIMEFSGDVLPWIGEAPPEISGRQQGAGKEWVAAGYARDGICTAWRAAQEVIARILRLEGGVGVIEEMDFIIQRVGRAKGLEGLVGMFFRWESYYRDGGGRNNFNIIVGEYPLFQSPVVTINDIP